MRDATFRPHHAFSVAEAFDIKDGEMPLFVGDEGYFSSIFDFPRKFWGILKKDGMPFRILLSPWCGIPSMKASPDGRPRLFLQYRGKPRRTPGRQPLSSPGRPERYGKKLLAVTMFMRRGLPFLYQGQELGMTNCPFDSIEQIDDIFTRDEYRTALDAGLSPREALQSVCRFSRDHARTPMQWDDSAHAGFSENTPWLQVNLNSGKSRCRRRTGSGFCPAVLQSSDRAAQGSALRRYNRIRQL